MVEKALRFTDDSSAIVTIGIRPTRAETGYGYIAAADQLQTDKEIFTVDAFKEKPDKETAEKYLSPRRAPHVPKSDQPKEAGST